MAEVTENEYTAALGVVALTRSPSAKTLTQELGVSRRKAGAILEEMERRGDLSAPNNQNKREILFDADLYTPTEKPPAAPGQPKKQSKGKGKGAAAKRPTSEPKKSRKGIGGRNEAWITAGMDEKLEAVRGWAIEGATVAEIAGAIGVSETTIYKWQNEKPEFAKAMRAGRHVSNGAIIASAFRQSTGQYVSTTKAVKVKDYKVFKDPETRKNVLLPYERVEYYEEKTFIAPNANMTMFMLANRIPEAYKKLEHVKHSGSLTPYADMTDEELEKEIERAKGDLQHGPGEEDVTGLQH